MDDLPKELRDQMKFVFVTDIRQVLDTAIEGFGEQAPSVKEGTNGHERARRRKGERAAAKA